MEINNAQLTIPDMRVIERVWEVAARKCNTLCTALAPPKVSGGAVGYRPAPRARTGVARRFCASFINILT